MKLSRTAGYAIHAVLHLASQTPGPLVIGHETARETGIPEGFLLRLLVALSQAGILASVKGPRGGYRLARPAKSISLLEVIEAVEGPLLTRAATVGKPNAIDDRLLVVFQDAAARVRRQFAAVSVADLAGSARKRRVMR